MIRSNGFFFSLFRHFLNLGNDALQVPMEVFGLMQQVYHRALYSLGPDVGCYAPPKLYENELNESLQVKEKSIYLLEL